MPQNSRHPLFRSLIHKHTSLSLSRSLSFCLPSVPHSTRSRSIFSRLSHQPIRRLRNRRNVKAFRRIILAFRFENFEFSCTLSDSSQSGTYNGRRSWIKFRAGSVLLPFRIFTKMLVNRTRRRRERGTRTKRSNDYAWIVSWNDRFSGDGFFFLSPADLFAHTTVVYTLWSS